MFASNIGNHNERILAEVSVKKVAICLSFNFRTFEINSFGQY